MSFADLPIWWHRRGGTKRCSRSQTGWGEVLDDSCHVTSAPKVTLLQLPSSLDASSAERGKSSVRRNFESHLVKNLLTQWWETEEENRGTNENILAPWGSWWVSNGHVVGEKPPNPVGELKRKTKQGSIKEKPPELNEETWDENRRIV